MRVRRTVMLVTLAASLTAPAPAPAGAADTPTTLLEAMAYVQPGTDVIGLDFADWAQLKRLHGGEGITSSSPLEERQLLLLDIARTEDLPFDLGLDRLATWPDAWGWDSTDLAWEGHYLGGRVVLRFEDHWVAEGLRAALVTSGYEVSTADGMEVWRWRGDFRELDASGPLGDRQRPPLVIGEDGRTVVIHRWPGGAPPRRLAAASRPDLARLADTPAVRVAALLDQPLAATLAAGRDGVICHRFTPDDRRHADDETVDLIDQLHVYRALAVGYSRSASDGPAAGRFVFSYARPWQAQADLVGRSALVEADPPWGPPGSLLRLVGASTDGRELVIDVEPVYGVPGAGLTGWRIASPLAAMCGPSQGTTGRAASGLAWIG